MKRGVNFTPSGVSFARSGGFRRESEAGEEWHCICFSRIR